MNRRPTVYETVALPLSYTGDARSANEPVKYGAGEGAASGKLESHGFFAGSAVGLGCCSGDDDVRHGSGPVHETISMAP